MSTGVIVGSGNSPYYVSSGQTDASDVVVNGGSLFVLSGGTMNRNNGQQGGSENIYAGGVDSGGTVEAGAWSMYFLSGAVTTAALVSGSVSSGVAAFAYEVVLAGGTASATTLADAGVRMITGLPLALS